MKTILDACCGGRLFWIDKQQKNTIYIDNRIVKPGTFPGRPNWSVEPDIVADFTKLGFKDSSFKLIIWDPPHIKKRFVGKGLLSLKYGTLNPGFWEETLKQGFKELWRVLQTNGVLIFKWSEGDIKANKVLELFGPKPLVGQRVNKGTLWFTFMKIRKDEQKKPATLL